MKDTKYKILAYFDNQSYRKLFNEINSDYAENLQILLHNLSLFSYDVLIIGVIVYKENISNIISAIRKITQIPIIILTDATSLLCMSWKKELIYAGADCVMDINSTTEEVDLQIFSLARRNNKQKITQKQSETMINKGKLVMDHKKHKVFWNDVALHLTRQEYNFLYLLAVTPMRVYTFEQIYQLVWKDYPVGDIKNIIWLSEDRSSVQDTSILVPLDREMRQGTLSANSKRSNSSAHTDVWEFQARQMPREIEG